MIRRKRITIRTWFRLVSDALWNRQRETPFSTMTKTSRRKWCGALSSDRFQDKMTRERASYLTSTKQSQNMWFKTLRKKSSRGWRKIAPTCKERATSVKRYRLRWKKSWGSERSLTSTMTFTKIKLWVAAWTSSISTVRKIQGHHVFPW